MDSGRRSTIEDSRGDVGEGRAETDASLGDERAAADDTIARTVADAERQLDALIARDRVLADRGVSRIRQSADARLADERSASPQPSSQVVQERHADDDSKRTERFVMDAELERERRRADVGRDTQRAATHAQHEMQRQRTNERLSDERSEADAVAAERDASESALEAAHDAEADRANVFAMVTHDLRNPLCVIMANAGVIAQDAEGAKASSTREAAADITHAAARMGRLLTDLLDVARIDAGTFPLNKRPHSVRALLSEVRRSYRSLFDDCGVTLTVEVPPEDVVASFDHDRVVQVLSNLLGNATKFTPRGGNVGVHVEHDADTLVFGVRDDGTGVHPDALPHLFEPFWQRDPDTRRGLGLGLYLSRTIATAHGGDISVQSEVGVGSTFSVWLPTH